MFIELLNIYRFRRIEFNYIYCLTQSNENKNAFHGIKGLKKAYKVSPPNKI